MPTVAPQEWDLLADLHVGGKRTVSLPDDHELILRHSVSPAQLLGRMARKGLLRRISRGRYVVVGPGGGTARQEVPTFVLLDAALAPRRYAVSFLSALAYHGLTDHEPHEVTLLLDERPNAPKPTSIAGLPVRARVERRDHRWSFGIRTESEAFGKFRIADPERAVIDGLDQPALSGGPDVLVRALARGLKGELRRSRLIRYGASHSVRVARRLGYLLETLSVAPDDDLHLLLQRARSTRRYDRLFGLDGEDDDDDEAVEMVKDSKWRLEIDFPADLIRSWASYELVQ